MGWSGFLTIRCVDSDSWLSAVEGGSGVIYTRVPVPFLLMFRVRFGGRGLPDFVDCRHRFVSHGSKKVKRGVYATRVRVVPLGSVV